MYSVYYIILLLVTNLIIILKHKHVANDMIIFLYCKELCNVGSICFLLLNLNKMMTNCVLK